MRTVAPRTATGTTTRPIGTVSPRVRTLTAAGLLAAALIATPAGTSTARSAAGPSESPANRVTAQSAHLADYLAAHPGGTPINATEIAYPGGLIVTVTPPAGQLVAAADCPPGWFCFYDGVNFGYPRGRLSDCGFQDLATWGWTNRTESVHYNMSTGSVAFYNHTSGGDTRLFTISTSRRTDNDVSPYRNQADRVYRFCS
jgi:hypothetical protein